MHCYSDFKLRTRVSVKLAQLQYTTVKIQGNCEEIIENSKMF